MKANTRTSIQQKLIHVADCLYRSDATGIYYAIFERDGRQVKRSLKTTDPELAKRRRNDLRTKVERLTSAGKALPFAEYEIDEKAGGPTPALIGGLAKRWIDLVGKTVEPSTRDRYLGNIQQLAGAFKGLTMRGLTMRQIEQWSNARECAAETFNKERDVLVRILDYAVEHGIILDNHARRIKRRRGHKKAITIPTRDQFRQMLQTMRENDGHDSADLCEMLAYSGCRKSEIVGDVKYAKPPMLWRDVNFQLKTFTVTRSKNHEPRTVPLFPAMESFLLDLKARRETSPSDHERIITIDNARQALGTASKKVAIPKAGHHTLRHFFCSNAIEAGVDFKVIAGWLGHKDGGVLVARTYGHLRNEHSAAMAKRMGWSAANIEPANVVQLEQSA